MLPERLRSIFRRESELAPPAGVPGARPGSLSGTSGHRAGSRNGSHNSISPGQPSAPVTRPSRGVEQFFFNIRDVVGLSILDLAGANQENIMYLTSLGHKVYSEDLVRGLDDAFGMDPAEQTNVSRIDHFLRSNFDYLPDTFDGVLLWDSMQFMSPALLTATVDRLYDVMKPQSYLLAYFSANERLTEVPAHAFRLVDNKTITISERGIRPPGHVFNNRNLEKAFSKFESVKFFLTRESLREVIVRR